MTMSLLNETQNYLSFDKKHMENTATDAFKKHNIFRHDLIPSLIGLDSYLRGR